MISINNLTKYYPTNQGKKIIFKDLSVVFPDKKNIGIIGLNGSGKSTLLRMIAGIDYPNEGHISSSKIISWPLGLSGGTQGSLSGRDNAKFVCRIFGDCNSIVSEKLRYIKNFSELGDYFEMPVKTYSSGMRSRLIFAISMAFDFDLYLIDELTAVGDEKFKKKSRQELNKKRKTSNYIMVSHNANELIKESDVLAVVHDQDLRIFDNPNEGLRFYRSFVKKV